MARSDFAAKKPVVADTTLFRPGSISKVFTAIAVMQLVEQGKLDLDRDVNEYLDFAIPKTYAEPVTLRRLLTHTAGFEETLKNLFVPSAREMRPLRDYLVAAMPARIFPPGKVPSYSNYGLTLAGYIVERVSGEPFEKYIAAHILDPLRMEHSSFAQPLPEALAPNMSRGYLAAAQGARDFEFVTASPAGALSATATDMSRLMLALLGEGTLEGATILKPESVRAMEVRQFELHPDLHAMGFILMDYSMNGQRIVGHGGDTIYFHSDMMLMPDAHAGLFISYNSAGSRQGGGRTEVIRAFLNRYFPEPVSASPSIELKTTQADGQAVSGVYSGSRRSESTFLKMAAVLGQFSVTADHNGLLTIEGLQSPRGGLKQWREIGPLVYREVDGPDVIAFRRRCERRRDRSAALRADPDGATRHRLCQQEATAAGVGFEPGPARAHPGPLACRGDHPEALWAAPVFHDNRSRSLSPVAIGLPAGNRFRRADRAAFKSGGQKHRFHRRRHRSVADRRRTSSGGWPFSGLLVLTIAAVRFWRAPGLGWWARVHATLLWFASVLFLSFAWWAHLLTPSLRF